MAKFKEGLDLQGREATVLKPDVSCRLICLVAWGAGGLVAAAAFKQARFRQRFTPSHHLGSWFPRRCVTTSTTMGRSTSCRPTCLSRQALGG